MRVFFCGCLLKHNFCGYTTFEVDITDYAKFDEKNVLSVYDELDVAGINYNRATYDEVRKNYQRSTENARLRAEPTGLKRA